MNAQSLHTVLVALGTICLSASLVSAQESPGQSIGLFTAAQGDVTVTHPGSVQVQPVSVHDQVLFRDVIETQNESRTKAFFEDDSILTIGENSRVEITEYVYNPDQKMRRTVVKLLQGQLRALVSKVFTGSGSKFEIHTPTAVAAARGTYFVVWVEDGVSGIANIGNSGRVAFTSGEKEIIVDPGRFSTAVAGGVPTPPNVISAGPADSGQNVQKAEEKIKETAETQEKVVGTIQQTEEKVAEKTPQEEEKVVEKKAKREHRKHAPTLARVMNAIEGTTLKDSLKRETAKDVVRAQHHLAVSASPLVSAIAKRSSGTNQTSTGKSVNAESNTVKEKRRHDGHEFDITKKKSIQFDNEAALTEGSSTTSVAASTGAGQPTPATQTTPTGAGSTVGAATPAASVTSTGTGPVAGPATPSVAAAPTTVAPVAPAAPAAAVVPAAPVVAVAPAAPVVTVPTPNQVAPTVKVAPIAPPAVIYGALDRLERQRSRNRR